MTPAPIRPSIGQSASRLVPGRSEGSLASGSLRPDLDIYRMATNSSVSRCTILPSRAGLARRQFLASCGQAAAGQPCRQCARNRPGICPTGYRLLCRSRKTWSRNIFLWQSRKTSSCTATLSAIGGFVWRIDRMCLDMAVLIHPVTAFTRTVPWSGVE